MKIFDRYVLKNLAVAMLFIAATLAVVVFLTQSLRFLELVMESGASGATFWIITFLAMPRFFEIILPIALMAGVVFIYNRMSADSELVAIRAAGVAPLALARPAIILAVFVTCFLWAITMWISPKALSGMQHMRQIIKAQVSALLFREGVFNQAGTGLTVYMRERTAEGELRGLMIHDSRDKAANPSTVLARRGVIVMDEKGEQVVVYDGSRQEYDRGENILHRLNFDRYTLDLPESSPINKRWREPEERTIFELAAPDGDIMKDPKRRYEFLVEIHRRVAAPLMALALTFLSCAVLLPGPLERRGQGRKIALAIAGAVLLQAGFLAAFSLSRQTPAGIPLMYMLVVVPVLAGAFFLGSPGESLRRRVFYVRRQTA